MLNLDQSGSFNSADDCRENDRRRLLLGGNVNRIRSIEMTSHLYGGTEAMLNTHTKYLTFPASYSHFPCSGKYYKSSSFSDKHPSEVCSEPKQTSVRPPTQEQFTLVPTRGSCENTPPWERAAVVATVTLAFALTTRPEDKLPRQSLIVSW